MTKPVKRITKEEFLALVAEWGKLQGSVRVMSEEGWSNELALWIQNRTDPERFDDLEREMSQFEGDR